MLLVGLCGEQVLPFREHDSFGIAPLWVIPEALVSSRGDRMGPITSLNSCVFCCVALRVMYGQRVEDFAGTASSQHNTIGTLHPPEASPAPMWPLFHQGAPTHQGKQRRCALPLSTKAAFRPLPAVKAFRRRDNRPCW